MAHKIEVVELQTELRSIERLINDLLQRQAALCSRLESLERVDNEWPFASDVAAASTVVHCLSSSPSWSTVVKGKRKVSLPLFDSFGANDIALSNLFSPLAKLPAEPVSPPPARRAARVRKRSSSTGVTSPSDSPSSSSAPPGCKRPRFSCNQPQNCSHVGSVLLSLITTTCCFCSLRAPSTS